MQRKVGAVVIAALAMCIYWRTAFPTITWWDSASYSLAASTLGITSPPGSLLLTLLGWPIAHLPLGTSPAYRLNLLAGALATVTAVFVYCIALRIQRMTRPVAAGKSSGASNTSPPDTAATIGAALGALTFAFGSTIWTYATQFTPYVLTVVFTGAILWTLLRWWEDALLPNSWRWLAILGLLFGLDFSVHRTNAVLLPAALAWILIRNASVLRQPRSLMGGAVGLVAGLMLQLLIIPISAFTNSQYNFNPPDTLGRFWDHVRLAHLGGGFLIDIFPRNSPLWSVQVADLLSTLRDSYFHTTGVAGALGFLPALAAVLGVGVLWRRDKRFTIALLMLLLLQAVVTVMYFNIPENFFRTMARHYLPICFIVGVFAACGISAVVQAIGAAGRSRPKAILSFAVAGVALIPLGQLLNNWRSHDASERFFVRDYAVNSLQQLPQNAIYLTVGDNDTFPIMYLQSAEHVREDVRVVNTSVLHFDRHPELLRKLDPTFPVSLSREQRMNAVAKPWTDTLVTVPVLGSAEQVGLESGMQIPPAIQFVVKPPGGGNFYAGDIALLDIVRTNAFRRPITFSTTASPEGMSWLAPYGRLEGTYWRIVPQRAPAPNVLALRTNLLQKNSYRGYNDSTVIVDDVAGRMGYLYYDALTKLAKAEHDAGNKAQCVADIKLFMKLVPPSRIIPPDSTVRMVQLTCE